MAAAASLMGSLISGLVVYLLSSLAFYKLFQKAGEAGWKGFVPFLNYYIQFKLTWSTSMFWTIVVGEAVGSFISGFDGVIGAVGVLIMFACGVLYLVSLYKLGKAYGKGIGFILGLIFITPIFMLILGFGSSEYEGPQ